MVLFFGKRKREQQKAAEDEALRKEIAQMLVNVLGFSEVPPEEAAKIKERQRLVEEGRAIRRQRIAEAGVDVEMFTEDKIRGDSLSFLNAFMPSWRLLNLDESNGQDGKDFPNLTKTGNLPKNVCDAGFSITEEPQKTREPNDHLSVRIKYLKDGSVNMADIFIGCQSLGYTCMIRRVEEEFRITSIVRKDFTRWVDDTIYHDLHPQDQSTGIEILETEMRSSWG